MPHIDPHFERIARRLTTLELRQADGDDDTFDMEPGRAEGRAPHLFVQAYTAAGIRAVLREYGIEEKMKEQGVGDYEVKISEEDPFHHRLEILLPEGEPERHIADLRLHLSSLSLPGVEERADVVVVEWLLMQNPRRTFSRERPRLPGQRYPGTGLGPEVAQLLVLLCRRIGRDGLLTAPEHYHLAELYAAAGWRAVGPQGERDVEEILRAARHLPFAARAWAVERGFIRDEDDEPVAWVPHERVLAVSDKLERALSPGGFLWLKRRRARIRTLHVDLEGLRRSLVDDPVEGLDPEHL